LPGDAAFAHRERFDAILALYHDQGLGPVKALAFDRAVQVTRGLPVVRTSPAHGTAFDIARQVKASPNSMRAAMEWAIRLATR
jgi:4-hydroxythreonine-4-phosphate dehydrogenase